MVLLKNITTKNKIIRPAIANIDKIVIVSSVCQPSPNLFIIDKMTATAINKGIEPVIIFLRLIYSRQMSFRKFIKIQV